MKPLNAVLVAASFAAAAAGAQDKSPSMGSMPGMEMPGMTMSVTDKSGQAMPPGFAEAAVAPEIRQRIGVTLGTVQEAPLTMTVRAVGIIRPDETRLAHIHLKTEGWVDKLFVSYTGQHVRAGEPLLSIYSPAFFAAEREFLSALHAAKAGLDKSGDQQMVVETARRRLELWDIPDETIDQLQRSGVPGKSLTLRSPISGTIIEKKVFDGQYVMPQDQLYIVADLGSVWMQAKVFEYELPHVAVGMPVTVTISSFGTRQFPGRVAFIDPVIDEMSRTVQVRVELANADGLLKPGMFGRMMLEHEMGRGLTVPASAVIRTGERDIAYRAESGDRFVPVEVKLGASRFGDRYQIIDGLKAGDRVVTSANFLVDSESRLRAGGGGMAGMAGMDMGPAPAKPGSGHEGTAMPTQEPQPHN